MLDIGNTGVSTKKLSFWEHARLTRGVTRVSCTKKSPCGWALSPRILILLRIFGLAWSVSGTNLRLPPLLLREVMQTVEGIWESRRSCVGAPNTAPT